jgi:hypothetical protein
MFIAFGTWSRRVFDGYTSLPYVVCNIIWDALSAFYAAHCSVVFYTLQNKYAALTVKFLIFLILE